MPSRGTCAILTRALRFEQINQGIKIDARHFNSLWGCEIYLQNGYHARVSSLSAQLDALRLVGAGLGWFVLMSHSGPIPTPSAMAFLDAAFLLSGFQLSLIMPQK